jgi:hypothetical protein
MELLEGETLKHKIRESRLLLTRFWIGRFRSPGRSMRRKPLVTRLVRNTILDQKEIWASPFHIRRQNAKWWLFVWSATGGLIAAARTLFHGVAKHQRSAGVQPARIGKGLPTRCIRSRQDFTWRVSFSTARYNAIGLRADVAQISHLRDGRSFPKVTLLHRLIGIENFAVLRSASPAQKRVACCQMKWLVA